MRMSELADRLVTYEDYLRWPETTVPCEFVDGRVVMTPSPGVPHQRAGVRLTAILTAASPAELEVLVSPIDWVLRRDPLLVRQPDVVVIDRALGDQVHLTAPPVLAVEVVSPTSRERDLITKRAQYATAGLEWYWLVDLDGPQVLVLRRANGDFERHAFAQAGELLAVEEPFAVALRPEQLLA